MREIKVEVSELGPESIPDELRNRLTVEVRPLRLAVIHSLLGALRGITQVDPVTLQAIIDAERAAGPPRGEDADKAAHTIMLSGLELIAELTPRVAQWGEQVNGAAEKYAGPTGGECECPRCVAKRQSAAGETAQETSGPGGGPDLGGDAATD